MADGFLNMESTGITGQAADFKSIALAQLQRIARMGSKEMRGGYWQERTSQVGHQVVVNNVYVPDTREEYANAVCVLADMCLPHFDEEMRKAEEENEKEMNELDEEFEGKDSEKEVDKYKEKMWKVRRRLFRELSRFMERKDYFADMGEEDVDTYR